MGLPSKLKDMALFADGTSYQGQIPEISLPKLTTKMEGYRGGGMLGEVDIDMGLDKLEMELTVGGLLTGLLAGFGATSHDANLLRFAGAYSDDTSRHRAVEVTTRGRLAEIDMGTAGPGKNTEHKYKYSLSYYLLVIDGVPRIEIDMVGGTFVVDGIDRRAEINAILGI